jgi:hypothetical protein
MLDEVRNGTSPLWSVEGLTRAAAVAPYGIPAVAYAGCFSWQADGKPLRCWDYVNLEGRLVYVVPDADWRTNENVQKGLEGQVSFLESRGARVLVIPVPEIDGDEHTGLDDAIARGMRPEALARGARPFERADVGRERLRRDEGLRRFIVEKLLEVEELPARKAGECNAVKVARYLVGTAALRHGKLEERGVRVRPGARQIAAGVRIGLQTTHKALKHLEGIGFLERLEGRRGPKEAASYLLLYPWRGGSELSEHIGTEGAREGESQENRTENGGKPESSLSERVSYLCVHSTRGVVKREKESEKVPALRNSKLVHTFGRREGRRVVVDSQYFRRYGAKREEIIRLVLELGGAPEEEIHERFGSRSSRLRDFRRTWLRPMLNDGVLVRDGAHILPAPDWREALERVRTRTDEEADNRRQDERFAESRRKYREHIAAVRRGEIPAKADREGELLGKERTAEILEEQRPNWERARVEEQRAKVGTTAAVFLADEMEGVLALRWQELRARWTQRGGRGEDLRLAVQDGPYRFEREEADERHLYVYHGKRQEAGEPRSNERAPASVVRIPNGAPVVVPEAEDTRPRKPYRREDGVYVHPPDCACEWCEEPVAPRYVRPYSGGIGDAS